MPVTDNRHDATPQETQSVLRFWFTELAPEQWWKMDAAVDRLIAERFTDLHAKLADGVPESWLASAHSRLAAVIVLDQFSRNLYRDDARAYACDACALALAQETIELELDAELSKDEKAFLYMPFEHCEEAAMQDRSVALFTALGDDNYLDFAVRHKVVIDRFGRFPHRNKDLGRESTPEEEVFLTEGRGF